MCSDKLLNFVGRRRHTPREMTPADVVLWKWKKNEVRFVAKVAGTGTKLQLSGPPRNQRCTGKRIFVVVFYFKRFELPT